MRLILAITICVLLPDVGTASGDSMRWDRNPAVSYCYLVRNPHQFNGKIIRVTGIYRYGYEWSELYCGDCINEAATWVDFDEAFSSSTIASVRRKLDDNGFRGRTVLVTMTGKFEAGGGYGHNKVHPFRFLVTKVSSARILLNDSPVPSALPKRLRSRVSCK